MIIFKRLKRLLNLLGFMHAWINGVVHKLVCAWNESYHRAELTLFYHGLCCSVCLLFRTLPFWMNVTWN